MSDESLTLIDVSNALGLVATGALLINLMLGLIIATRMVSRPWWRRLPRRLRVMNILRYHRWVAFLALAVAAAHPTLLLFDDAAKFRFSDIVFPIDSPHQNVVNTLGALSFYALLILVVTSLGRVRKKLRFRTWKLIHYAAFALTPTFLLHGLLIDQTLKDAPVDYVDAEKVLSEAGLILFLIVVVYRLRFARKQRLAKAARLARGGDSSFT